MPVDNSIALQTKVPDGMASLGSMLNIARGAQEYGQAQQMNPIALQAAQQEADYAKLKNPELVSQAREATKQSQFSTKQDYQKALDQGLSALSQNPAILEGSDPTAISRAIIQQRQMLIRSGVPEDQAEIGAAQLISAAHTDPKSVVNLLATYRRNQIPAAQQQSNITGAQSVEGTTPGGNPRIMGTNPATGEKTFAAGAEAAPVANRPNAQPALLPPTETPSSNAQLQEKRIALSDSAATINQGIARIDGINDVLDTMVQGKAGEAAGRLSSMLGYAVPIGTESAAARAILNKDIAGLAPYVNGATNGKYASSFENAVASIADKNAPDSAIRSSMATIKPLLVHVSNMNNGLQKVIDNTKGDPAAQRKFHNEMANAYKPTTVNALDAIRNGKATEFLSKFSATEVDKIEKDVKKYNDLINGKL